jgi:hypothetical protein
MKIVSWSGPPYLFKVWVRGEQGFRKMSGLNKRHIMLQLKPLKIKLIKQIQEI